jgi:hypothetical protein
MTSSRELTTGQAWVLGVTAAAMVIVGGIGAAGTYSNAVTAFHREATAAGIVAAGEGLTFVLALIMLVRTMLNMSAPLVVRGGMWLSPVSASAIGIAIASDAREAAVYAVTPLAMSGAAEGLGFVARSVVVYRTGRDAEADRRNAATVQQLAYQQALASGHPDKDVQEAATRKAWKLVGRLGAGDPKLAEGLVDVSRTKLTAGAGHALGRMLALPDASAPTLAPAGPKPRPVNATEALRALVAGMDPVDAVRFAAEARPDAGPAELANVLDYYGFHVDPVVVALVLGQRPAQYTVERSAADVAPQLSELPALGVQGAVAEAAAALGESATAREIAEHLERTRRLVVPENHIRAALSRAAKRPERETDASPRNTDMEGGYA